MITRARTLTVFLAIVVCAAVASAQERVSLRPVFTVGQESRYNINASVETVITPTGAVGIAANQRKELTATVLVRTAKLGDKGEIYQEATVEAITLNSGTSTNATAELPAKAASVGQKIEFTIDQAGDLLKCSIPKSEGFLTAADLLFSLMRWYPADEVNVGGSWEATGQGPIHTDRLSEISRGATTAYKLASLTKSIAIIEGVITLNQNGTSGLNASGIADIGVIASGKGTSHFDFDVAAGRVVGCVTESRLEGKVLNTQPTAAGEKLRPREGYLIETAKFSIKLIQ